jgi:hypothetical protein
LNPFGENAFKLEYLRWMLFSFYLIVQEAWLWDWWVSIGASLAVTFVSVSLLVSLARVRPTLSGAIESDVAARLKGLRTKLTRQSKYIYLFIYLLQLGILEAFSLTVTYLNSIFYILNPRLCLT